VADHASHARHDRFAVVDAVGGGALPMTIRGCPACGTLYADLLSLQHAVRNAWTPARPRDLRLTLADATRLQRGRWRRWLARIGGPTDALTRPLALSVTGLGLAGLLLTGVPPLPLGSQAAGQAELHIAVIDAGSGASPAASAAAAWAPSNPADGPGRVATSNPPDVSLRTDSRVTEPPRPLLPVSFALVAIGAALFTLRRIAAALRPVR
jgi:hypothetical protein